ncbi:hypothetical protein P43SY_009572 [Pythium insidiosum]|uniref:Fe2OG dioxygenase domain-containing protein n=1 Tax=Pythium insidiosum TaxID=114742 RepID=A0AAD5QBP5_PYTIN|nr:hypothetical protein P43SY_009572 [Pythium insidiosum]
MRQRHLAARRLATSCLFSTAAPLPRPPAALLDAAAASWRARVTPALASQLLRDGYAVVPNAFPPAFTAAIRREMHALHASQQLYPNATHVLLSGDDPQPTLLQKHHILETELVLPEIRRQVPTLEWFFDSQLVFAAMRAALPPWLQLSAHMIKLQLNEGGCFPLHFDSYGDDGKCLTAVLYLNDAWQPGDGGEIVLYPFPQRARVVVRPGDGDLVLFSSQQMLHRVLPSRRARYCLTTWMYCDKTPRAPALQRARQRHYDDEREPEADGSYEQQVLRKIVRSPTFRRHLAKLFHRDEWRQSLQESHVANDAFRRFLATHDREVALIEAATTQMLHRFRAKDPSATSSVPATSQELLDVFSATLRADAADTRSAWLQRLPIEWF